MFYWIQNLKGAKKIVNVFDYHISGTKDTRRVEEVYNLCFLHSRLFLLLSSLCELARSTLVERQQLSTQSTNAFDTGCKKLVLHIRRRKDLH